MKLSRNTTLALTFSLLLSFIVLQPAAVAFHGSPGEEWDENEWEYVAQGDREMSTSGSTCPSPNPSGGTLVNVAAERSLISLAARRSSGTGGGGNAGLWTQSNATAAITVSNTGSMSGWWVDTPDTLAASDPRIVKHVNISPEAFWAIIEITPLGTGNHYADCGWGADQGTSINFNMTGNGRKLDRVHGFIASSSSALTGSDGGGILIWRADPTRGDEAALLEAQVETVQQAGWPDYKLRWNRLDYNISENLGNTGYSQSDGSATIQLLLKNHPAQGIGQSHFSTSSQPIIQFRARITSSATCTGQVTFSMMEQPEPFGGSLTGDRWEPSKEVWNVTGELTLNGTTEKVVYATPGGAWVEGASEGFFNNATAVRRSNNTDPGPTAYNFTTTPNSFAIGIFSPPGSSGGNCGDAFSVGTRSYSSGGSGGTGNFSMQSINGATYSVDPGGTSNDWDDLDVRSSDWCCNATERKPTYHYNISLTASDVGGAYYVFIREKAVDGTLSAYEFNTTGYGTADEFSISSYRDLVGLSGFANSSWRIEVLRLAYDGVPRNGTATLHVVLNRTQSGFNELYFGTLQNQNLTQRDVRPVPGVGRLWASGSTLNTATPVPFYRVHSTDDFTVHFKATVKTCLEHDGTDCTSFGNPIGSGSYAMSTSTGSTSGSWVNAAGQFNVSGQWMLGAAGQQVPITVVLSRAGENDTTIIVRNITAAGTWYIELGMVIDGTTQVTVAPTGLSLQFSGNRTRITPDTVSVNITRNNNSFALVVDCVRIDTVSGAVASACTAGDWPITAGSTYNFKYPQSVRTTTSQVDVGDYWVYVMMVNGTYVDGRAYSIGATWEAVKDVDTRIDVGPDLESQLSISTLNEYNTVGAGSNSARAAASETSIRQYWLNALDSALAPFADCADTTVTGADELPGCTLPKIGWWYLGTLILAAVGIAKGRRIS